MRRRFFPTKQMWRRLFCTLFDAHDWEYQGRGSFTIICRNCGTMERI